MNALFQVNNDILTRKGVRVLSQEKEIHSVEETDEILQNDQNTEEISEKKKEKEALQLERNRRKQVLELEKAISKCENSIKEIDNLLCAPDLYNNHEKAVVLTREREAIEKKINNLYDEWIELTEN